jgi:hypothetical protein
VFPEEIHIMKKSVFALVPLLVAAPLCSAHALGSFGARVGYGLHISDPEPVNEPTMIAVGAAWQLDLLVAKIEADLLWRRSTTSDPEITVDRLGLAALGRFGIPLVPGVFSLELIGGLEPRFLIGADPSGVENGEEAMVLFLPVGVGGALNLLAVELNLDIRYEHQLTASGKGSKAAEDYRSNNLTFLAGVFF